MWTAPWDGAPAPIRADIPKSPRWGVWARAELYPPTRGVYIVELPVYNR